MVDTNWANGLQLADGSGNIAYADHQNLQNMAIRGNRIVSGVGITSNANMTVNIASGVVVAGGVKVAVGAEATFAGVTAGANKTFANRQLDLTSGQSVFVFVHVDSAGVITNTDGVIGTTGSQTPPDVPEDEVILAMITLTFGDTIIDVPTDVEDWRLYVSKGEYIAGPLEVTGNINNSQILGDLAELTQTISTIPYFDSAITAALLTFRDQDDMAGDDALGVASQQSIKAYVDSVNMIGSANAKYVPLVRSGTEDLTDMVKTVETYIGYSNTNVVATKIVHWDLPKDLTQGGLTLRCSKWRFRIYTADTTNYVSRAALGKIASAATSTISLIDNNTSLTLNSQQLKEYTFTAHDLTGSISVMALLTMTCTDGSSDTLNIGGVELWCWYE